jgi:hypothetical protein
VSVGRVLAARSAHGDFADYHEWFGHDEAELMCNKRGRRKSPLHAWTCIKSTFRLSERFVMKLLQTDRGMTWLGPSTRGNNSAPISILFRFLLVGTGHS